MEIKNYFINLDKVIAVKKDYKNLELKIFMEWRQALSISYKNSKELNQDYTDLIIALI